MSVRAIYPFHGFYSHAVAAQSIYLRFDFWPFFSEKWPKII
jgi:hypothetical protein